MNLGIDGRCALVFGAGGGLGGAIATALAREGARIVAADIHLDSATSLAESLKAEGHDAVAMAWNLGDLAAIGGKVAEVQAHFGSGVDILVNNTGGPPPTLVSGQPLAIWQQHFEAMVLSVIAITDQLLPHMKARNWGRIVTSASSGVVAPIANLGLSNALRSTLLGWSKTLAREVAPHGITANVVVPGRIGTARIRALDGARASREGREVDDIVQDSHAAIPIGRYGLPEEYADVVAFLASRRASYVTGSVVRVDGGLIPSI